MRNSRQSLLLLLLLGAALCASVTGCSRKYWREQADDRAYNILNEKVTDPRWAAPRFDLQPDPRSRFFDPYDPDCPPLPPDDPAAREYLYEVYGMRGWKGWDKLGESATVENPGWLEPFGLPPSVVEANFGRPATLPDIKNLTVEEAVALSYIHSRDYQTQLEQVYAAALVLSFQRFQFEVQFLGLAGRRPSSDNVYTINPENPDSFQSVNRIGINRLFPSGAQAAVELVNNTLWIFSGGQNSSSTASTLSYSLVQPLLANGGRRFVLEGLTQSERDVLYALRNLARYRMGFFTSVVSGGNTAGISVGTPGVFTGVGPIPSPISQGGYLGLLQQRQGIANQQYNIRQLVERLDRLRNQVSQRPLEVSEPLPQLPANLLLPPEIAPLLRHDADQQLLFWRGLMSAEQREALLAASPDPVFQSAIRELEQSANRDVITQTIAQLETQLAQARIQLLTAQRLLQDTLDNYKIQIGLPTDLLLDIDTSLLKPFELIDPRLVALQDALNAYTAWAEIDSENPPLDQLREAARQLQEFRARLVRDGLDLVAEDFQRATQNLPQRLQQLPSDADRQRIQLNAQRDRRLYDTILDDFTDLTARLDALNTALRASDPPLAVRQELLQEIATLREQGLLRLAQGLQVVQINQRVELITLNPFQMELESALGIALDNRLDLMNLRASVVDARRRQEVAANQLQAVLNIVAAGDIRTLPLSSENRNPFDFRADQTSLRAGVNFTAPVQLIQQRNAYRAAIIGLQQARRNYMRTEDQVKLEVRTAWRQLTTLRQNFETAREAVRFATVQLDIAVEQLNSPVPQGAGGAQGVVLLQALQSVLNAQNNLIQIWVQYETNRLNIYNFMGILELDSDGFWTDEFYQERLRAARASGNWLLAPPHPFPPLPATDLPPSDVLPQTGGPQDLPYGPALPPSADGVEVPPPLLPPGRVRLQPDLP